MRKRELPTSVRMAAWGPKGNPKLLNLRIRIAWMPNCKSHANHLRALLKTWHERTKAIAFDTLAKIRDNASFGARPLVKVVPNRVEVRVS